MKSFKEMVGANADAVRVSRVNNFVNMFKTESQLAITTGKNSIQAFRRMAIELESLLDVAPETTVDLSAKLASIDSKELYEKVNSKVYDMVQCARAIKRRVALHNALFPEEPITGLTDEEIDFIKELI